MTSRRRTQLVLGIDTVILTASGVAFGWTVHQRELTLSDPASMSGRAVSEHFLLAAGIACFLVIASVVLVTHSYITRLLVTPLEGIARFTHSLSANDLLAAPPELRNRELRRTVSELDEFRVRHLDQAAALKRQREALLQRAPILSAVQRELAPKDQHQLEGLTISSHIMPAEGVLAGDWFHVFALDGDFVAVIIGDVAGHGAETGIFALQTKQLLMSGLRNGFEPGRALSWMSEHIGTTDEKFVTCFAAVVNVTTGSCRYANAGHPPALVRGSAAIALLGPTGPFIGPYPGSWSTKEVILEPKDILFVFTDGVSEARDEVGAELGVEGVTEMVRRAPMDVAQLVDFCVDEIHDKAINVSDDLTILAVQRTTPQTIVASEPVAQLAAGSLQRL